MATMTAEIITMAPQALQAQVMDRLDQNPVAAYLAGLANKRTQAVQRQALNEITDILAPGQIVAPNRPKSPGQRAPLCEKTAYAQALDLYRQDREYFDNRCFSLAWAALRYTHLQALRAVLADRFAAATANRLLSAVRGVLKNAFLLGMIPAEDYQRAVMVKAVTGETIPAGRGLSRGELNALKADCLSDPTPAGIRDAAIIAILYTCGLRRAELVGLQVNSFDPETGALKVHGKRNKDRTTYLVNGAAQLLANWLNLRGNEPGPMFFAINKGGRLVPGPMTAQALYNLLAKRGHAAGVKEFSPHDLRRTFCSDALEAGGDIAIVSKMMGHANIATTGRYDRRPELKKRQTASLLHF